MELLRWLLFIPSAAAGGMLGFAAGVLFAVVSKLFNRNLEADSPFVLIPIGCAIAYCWFIGGMMASPRSIDPKKILFTLTVIIVFVLGMSWAPLMWWFDMQEFISGQYVKFLWLPVGVIGTAAWMWFSKEAQQGIMHISRGTKKGDGKSDED